MDERSVIKKNQKPITFEYGKLIIYCLGYQFDIHVDAK